MKRILFILGILLAGAACASDTYKNSEVSLPDGFIVYVRLADTPEKTEKGLMFVKALPQDEGMLFLFDQEEMRVFWMKNTLIDLDIIFLNAAGKVNKIYEYVPHTYTYTPENEIPRVGAPAQYVLEVAAGTAARHQLKEGDTLSFTLP